MVADEEPAPDKRGELIAAVNDRLRTVLIANIYENPDLRTRIAGDVDDVAAFAADPFVARFTELENGQLGRQVIDCIMLLLN